MPETPLPADVRAAVQSGHKLEIDMNVLSLFSGIGGLDLGLERAGMTTVGQVEIDPYCQRVLAKHWPEVPRHDDVRTTIDWWQSEQRPRVDVVAGGFPCQPVSQAGLRLAQADERWLWPEMHAVITALRPTWVIAENVPGLRRRGLATVLHDLRASRYRARAGLIAACEMGASHPRERMLILAHTLGEHGCPWRADRTGPHPAPGHTQPGNQPQRRAWWPAEPDVGRVAHGVPGRMDRLRGLGNAVVPQVAEYIGRLILPHHHETQRSDAA